MRIFLRSILVDARWSFWTAESPSEFVFKTFGTNSAIDRKKSFRVGPRKIEFETKVFIVRTEKRLIVLFSFRRNVLMELFETEQIYVDELKTILEVRREKKLFREKKTFFSFRIISTNWTTKKRRVFFHRPSFKTGWFFSRIFRKFILFTQSSTNNFFDRKNLFIFAFSLFLPEIEKVLDQNLSIRSLSMCFVRQVTKSRAKTFLETKTNFSSFFSRKRKFIFIFTNNMFSTNLSPKKFGKNFVRTTNFSQWIRFSSLLKRNQSEQNLFF